MKRFTSLFLCVMVLLSALAVPARANGAQQIDILCYVAGRESAIPCTMVIQGNQVYIDARTAASFSGWELDFSGPGAASFSSGGRHISHVGSSITAFGETWFPIESLMDSLDTRVVASVGCLLFNPSNAAVQELEEVLTNYEQMNIAVDPDDLLMATGLWMAKVYNIAANFRLTDLIGHRYEKENYRTALYALLRRSSDRYETTISSLCAESERGIVSPISGFFETMGAMLPEDVLESFYAGSELKNMKDFVDGYESISGALTMSPSQLYSLMEEAAFYNGAFEAGAVGLKYLLETDPEDKTERRLLETAEQVLGVYRQNTPDQLRGIVLETALTISSNHLNNAAKKSLLGPCGTLLVSGVNTAMQTLPGVSAMDELEMCAVYFQLQSLAERQIRKAQSTNDYVRLKYAAILYYRCAYLAAAELVRMDDDAFSHSAKDLMLKIEEMEVRLLALSDSQLSVGLTPNEPISARILIGPLKDYAAFYQNLVDHYGELTVRDYFGTEYIEEGSGVIAPILTSADGYFVLTVFRQEGSDLIQSTYLDTTGEADFVHIEDRVIMTAGMGRTYCYAFGEGAGPLLSCVMLDTNVTAYSLNTEGWYIEETYYRGNPNENSIAAITGDAFDQMYDQFGAFPEAFSIDGSDGLFRISTSPAELKSRLIDRLNAF